MDITVRGAAPEEVDAVGALSVAAYVYDGLLDLATEQGYADQLRDAGGRARQAEILVAVDGDGVLLGTVTFAGPGSAHRQVARAGEAEFRMLAVDPAARRRGVAEALVHACLDRARQAGLERVVISSKNTMTTAHRLYTRLGFTRLPERDWSPQAGVELWAFGVGV
ncbi:GNAT family N-acetyltransferase [Streptomyces sp. SL13]|uniref:GNAT family N-acetyltransferase n=1 Tax=Streptantibioticus silvisoli TaxID=2705255 RepID=A0AA90GY66_9ACTN|nr:GNAT family N-acetyltransferase [Streptantibioticus silvisoli]MDI5966518.1 GNAT family N-acetyltransferase [Streptantibioticus silvisoli]MDI5970368.1 GNAT family N-acetyltransferase [Streptantibioticus silvisoli]